MTREFIQVHASGLSIGCAIQGSGDPLILIHGGEADHSMFDRLAAELAATWRRQLAGIRGWVREGRAVLYR